MVLGVFFLKTAQDAYLCRVLGALWAMGAMGGSTRRCQHAQGKRGWSGQVELGAIKPVLNEIMFTTFWLGMGVPVCTVAGRNAPLLDRELYPHSALQPKCFK